MSKRAYVTSLKKIELLDLFAIGFPILSDSRHFINAGLLTVIRPMAGRCANFNSFYPETQRLANNYVPDGGGPVAVETFGVRGV